MKKADKVKINKDTFKLIKEKHKLKLNKETNNRWEKFCNSISLEKYPTESWCRIKSFLKPKTRKTYPTPTLVNQTAKTNAYNTELFAESVERHFGIESNSFDDSNRREINQFVEAIPHIFIPLDSTNDGIQDKDDNHLLVADVDPKELINIVKFDLRKGKAPGHDTITHELLRLAIGTHFTSI